MQEERLRQIEAMAEAAREAEKKEQAMKAEMLEQEYDDDEEEEYLPLEIGVVQVVPPGEYFESLRTLEAEEVIAKVAPLLSTSPATDVVVKPAAEVMSVTEVKPVAEVSESWGDSYVL